MIRSDFPPARPAGISRPLLVSKKCRLEDVFHSSYNNETLLITSATAPFHVEWVSPAWSEVFGWSLDEVLGLDCKFLQGGFTDLSTVSDFMSRLVQDGGHAEMTILNYSKDGTILQSTMTCFPVEDLVNGGKEVTHIVSTATDLKIAQPTGLSSFDRSPAQEVGLTIDRRDRCNEYPNRGQLSVPSFHEWGLLVEDLPLSLILRYSLRSSGAIVITDREERILHVNPPWVELTGLSAMECQGMIFHSLFNQSDCENNELSHLEYLLREHFHARGETTYEGFESTKCTVAQTAQTTQTESQSSRKDIKFPSLQPLCARTASALSAKESEVNCTDHSVPRGQPFAVLSLSDDALKQKAASTKTPWGQHWQVRSSKKVKAVVAQVCPALIGTTHMVFLVVPRKVEKPQGNSSAGIIPSVISHPSATSSAKLKPRRETTHKLSSDAAIVVPVRPSTPRPSWSSLHSQATAATATANHAAQHVTNAVSAVGAKVRGAFRGSIISSPRSLLTIAIQSERLPTTSSQRTTGSRRSAIK
jgi:PAS domain-containing protein